MTRRAVKHIRRDVEINFLDSDDVVREAVSDTIRARVRDLLRTRPELTQAEFGGAIGRGYSWVSAFLKGTRDANDVTVVVRIARFFGVPVGFLLGEGKRGESALLVSVKAQCEELTDEGLEALALIAKTLPKKAKSPTAPAIAEAPDAARANRPKKRHT